MAQWRKKKKKKLGKSGWRNIVSLAPRHRWNWGSQKVHHYANHYFSFVFEMLLALFLNSTIIIFKVRSNNIKSFFASSFVKTSRKKRIKRNIYLSWDVSHGMRPLLLAWTKKQQQQQQNTLLFTCKISKRVTNLPFIKIKGTRYRYRYRWNVTHFSLALLFIY